jgi:hypothetical protein
MHGFELLYTLLLELDRCGNLLFTCARFHAAYDVLHGGSDANYLVLPTHLAQLHIR